MVSKSSSALARAEGSAPRHNSRVAPSASSAMGARPEPPRRPRLLLHRERRAEDVEQRARGRRRGARGGCLGTHIGTRVGVAGAVASGAVGRVALKLKLRDAGTIHWRKEWHSLPRAPTHS